MTEARSPSVGGERGFGGAAAAARAITVLDYCKAVIGLWALLSADQVEVDCGCPHIVEIHMTAVS